MPFTEQELVGLSDEIWELMQAIEEVRSSSSDRGKKITRAEARSLLKSILKLGSAVLIDIID